MQEWCEDLIQQAKEEQKRQIIDLYLKCATYEEIETKLHVSRRTISAAVSEFKIKLGNCAPESLQLFNHWSFSKRDPKYGLDGAPGRIPGQIVENVLYYTQSPSMSRRGGFSPEYPR